MRCEEIVRIRVQPRTHGTDRPQDSYRAGADLRPTMWAQELRDAVWEIVKYRANLAATLKDTRTVVGKLERFMAIVVQFLFLFLYLLVWNVSLPPPPKQVPAQAYKYVSDAPLLQAAVSTCSARVRGGKLPSVNKLLAQCKHLAVRLSGAQCAACPGC